MTDEQRVEARRCKRVAARRCEDFFHDPEAARDAQHLLPYAQHLLPYAMNALDAAEAEVERLQARLVKEMSLSPDRGPRCCHCRANEHDHCLGVPCACTCLMAWGLND